MRYQIYPASADSIPDVTARIQAIGPESRGLIREMIEAAIEAGRKVAEAEAPRGPLLERNEGGRISDSIQVRQVRYSPGGSGGGGFFEADLYADSLIAPHLPYVYQGTANEGEGKIFPSRGNVLDIQKEGEGKIYRRWAKGQKPQTEWWEHARETVEVGISSGIQRMNIGRL